MSKRLKGAGLVSRILLCLLGVAVVCACSFGIPAQVQAQDVTFEQRLRTLLEAYSLPGRRITYGAQQPLVFLKDDAGMVLLAKNNLVPPDGVAGFAKGCILIKTDAAAGGVYDNIGTTTSCLFRLLSNNSQEVWVGDPQYGSTIFDVIATLAGTPATVRLAPGTYPVSIDTIVPATISLRPERGATIAIATTKTLTINSTFEAGLYQVFSCTGTGRVVFGPGSVKEAFPQWFGAAGDGATNDAAAFNSLLAAVGADIVVNIPPVATYYNLGTTPLIMPKIVDIRGNNSRLVWGAVDVASAGFKFTHDYVTGPLDGDLYYYGNKKISGVSFETTNKNTRLVWAPYGLKRVTFEGCNFLGAATFPADTNTYSGIGLQIDGKYGTRENWTSDGLAFRDCNFEKLDTLVYLNGDTQGPGAGRTGIDSYMDMKLFQNCNFEHFRRGVVMEYCHGIVFERNTIMPSAYGYLPVAGLVGNPNGGFRLDLTECSGITIIGNYFENVGTDTDLAKIKLNNTYSANQTYAPITLINNNGLAANNEIGQTWFISQMVGTGLNDITARGILQTALVDSKPHYYDLVVVDDGATNPNTFTWALNGGATTTLNMSTGAWLSLNANSPISVSWAAQTGHTAGDTFRIWLFPPVFDASMPATAGAPGVYNKLWRTNFLDGFGLIQNNFVMSPNLIFGSGGHGVLHSVINDNGGNVALSTNWDPYTNTEISAAPIITMEFVARSATEANDYISIRHQNPGAGQAATWTHDGSANPTYGTEVARIDLNGDIKMSRALGPSILTGAPASPYQGMICIADRATWDPCSIGSGGPYVVWYNGSAWARIDAQ